MDGTDSSTVCDQCQEQFDIGDIYDVDDESLCLECWACVDTGAPQ